MQAVKADSTAPPPLAYFVLLGAKSKCRGLLLANELRLRSGCQVLTHLPDTGMKAQLKKADQSRAEFAVIIGDNELQQGVASVKNLTNGSQETVGLQALVTYLTP